MDHNHRVLYVENLALDTQEAELRELFSKFGRLHGLELPTFSGKHALCQNSRRQVNRGHAFIEFASEQDSNKALAFFNNINNILYMHQQANSQAASTDDNKPQNPFPDICLSPDQLTAFSLLRVMRKDVYLNLGQRYSKQRYLARIRAAKLLVV